MSTQEVIIAAAGLITLVAFTALILVPAVSSVGRTWEKATVTIVSVFVLIVLVGIGLAVGALIVYYWDSIGTWFN